MRNMEVAVIVALVLAGSAYAQACDPVEADKLLASDGAAWDAFGYSVSISGDTVLVGANPNVVNGSGFGSAYVFTRAGGVWAQQAKLLPRDGAFADGFGHTVSLSGDTAVIGAPSVLPYGSGFGSAYVFTRSEGVWTERAKLLPADGALDDRFGRSVSVSGDTALIGAYYDDDNGPNSGSAYVFTRSGGVWAQQAKLLPADGRAGDQFGNSVSISVEATIIGAGGDDDQGNNSGSAYIFTRNEGVWTEQAKLLPDDGTTDDYFGESVSISSNSVVIGAAGNDDNGLGSGSAYVFTRNGGVWTQQAKLRPDDGAAYDSFGISVSVGGNAAVIGAMHDDDNGDQSGSAYVFTRSGGMWTQQAKLLPNDGTTYDFFGSSVCISSDTAIVGAFQDNDNGAYSGSAYVFDLGCGDCPPDLNGDSEVNTQDFLAFLNLWTAGDPLADWNDDGLVNTQDFLAYLNDWVAGCP